MPRVCVARHAYVSKLAGTDKLVQVVCICHHSKLTVAGTMTVVCGHTFKIQ